MERDVRIGSLPLPEGLLCAMYERRWVCPPMPVLKRVFRETPTKPVFYPREALPDTHARWLKETNPAFFGHPDPQAPPGDIDRELSLLLGELGPDCLFALDFRASMSKPSVIYLHSGGDRWITVAPTIDDLLHRLRLDGRSRIETDGQPRKKKGSTYP